MTTMNNEALEPAARDALLKLARAVEINDGDTLSRLSPDSKVIWSASGSWTGCVQITLGDLRAIAILAPAVVAQEVKTLRDRGLIGDDLLDIPEFLRIKE